MSEKKEASRAWELDFARGVAVVLMVLFHAVFDLSVYHGFDIDYSNGFWFYVGRLSAIMFIYISGISSTFSKNPAKRGLVVLLCALVVTAVSIPIMGDYYIRFGILHFFGVVMLLKGLAGLFIKINNLAAALTIPVSAILGRVFAGIHTDNPFLFPIGITNFSSYDYYPIFPWLAFFAAGVLTGDTLYKNKKGLVVFKSRYTDKGAVLAAPLRLLCFLGKHSLIVYMVHQPLLLMLLYLLFNFV